MAADQHDATRHGRLSAPWRTDRCYGRERANSTAHKASSSRSPGARPYTPGRVPGAIPPLSEARGISTTDATAHRLDRRSEEHTSELQSQSNLVCRLLLEKKKTKYIL